jgi:hypothetical protein
VVEGGFQKSGVRIQNSELGVQELQNGGQLAFQRLGSGTTLLDPQTELTPVTVESSLGDSQFRMRLNSLIRSRVHYSFIYITEPRRLLQLLNSDFYNRRIDSLYNETNASPQNNQMTAAMAR